MDTLKIFQNKVDKLNEQQAKEILKDLLKFLQDEYNDYNKDDSCVSIGFGITKGWLFNRLIEECKQNEKD